jgi:hypothetical protein
MMKNGKSEFVLSPALIKVCYEVMIKERMKIENRTHQQATGALKKELDAKSKEARQQALASVMEQRLDFLLKAVSLGKMKEGEVIGILKRSLAK